MAEIDDFEFHEDDGVNMTQDELDQVNQAFLEQNADKSEDDEHPPNILRGSIVVLAVVAILAMVALVLYKIYRRRVDRRDPGIDEYDGEAADDSP